MRSGVGAGSGSFGARLLAGRLAVGLSQEELAGRSGLSVRAIRMLERGKTRWPHPDTVRRLADALRLDGDARAGFVAAADRRLGRDGPGAAAGPAGGATLGEGAGLEVPRQLPATLAAFVGRDGELAAVTGMAREQSAVIVISGMAGAGKTALALRWAHEVAGRFPDGQLHADLHGFGPSDAPADPAAVLRGFLAALGVPDGRVPAGVEEAAGLYRSVLAGRRVLVFLDNARDEQQVRPLLPGSAASVSLVTSRRNLTGLLAREGAGTVLVGVLPMAQAQELIARRVGSARAAAEPGAVAELARLCGRLPLALAAVAARAADRPGVPLAALAAELRGNACLLEALEAGDEASSVRGAFWWSWRSLSGPAARMFRLLGAAPGPDVSVAAAARLAAAGLGEARALLAELADAHLVTEHAPGRYVLHDLLRDYAAGQARAEAGMSCAPR